MEREDGSNYTFLTVRVPTVTKKALKQLAVAKEITLQKLVVMIFKGSGLPGIEGDES